MKYELNSPLNSSLLTNKVSTFENIEGAQNTLKEICCKRGEKEVICLICFNTISTHQVSARPHCLGLLFKQAHQKLLWHSFKEGETYCVTYSFGES